ncbi:hypothetical protein LR48_Vigan07g102500 [Vigna angularis]|uniref:Uncharacterized protein n=1 Tax=Phaseolus angularis TaxID=3914 RepID=A0A0L9UX64_PHAAN|nr:hypothetical protein LR48_Vigan07g102500 [Vigna angularis]
MVCSEVDKYLKAVSDSKEEPKHAVNLVMDVFPLRTRTRLKETVKLMVDAGLGEECNDIYSKWRREFLEECLRVLGLQFQTPNTEDVHMWLKTCKAVGKILFRIESRLCDYLFSGLSVADVSFKKDSYFEVMSDSKKVPQPDVNLVMDSLPPGIRTHLEETKKLMSLMKDVSLKSLVKETPLKSLMKEVLLKSDEANLVEEIHEGSLVKEIHEGSLSEEIHEGSLVEEIHVGSLVEESHEGSLESNEGIHVEEFHKESHVKESRE